MNKFNLKIFRQNQIKHQIYFTIEINQIKIYIFPNLHIWENYMQKIIFDLKSNKYIPEEKSPYKK